MASFEQSPEMHKFCDFMHEFQTGMLTTLTENGELRSRPMHIAQVEENGNVWFVTKRKTGKVEEAKKEGRVCVTFQDKHKYISLSGHCCIMDHDQNKVDELWSEMWRSYFPLGKEDPELILLKVVSVYGEYWNYTTLNFLNFVFQSGKTIVTSLTGSGTTLPEKKVEENTQAYGENKKIVIPNH